MGTDIFEKIEAHLQAHRMSTWEGTFRDYLDMVIKQPSMIKRTGVQLDDEGKEHYTFFEDLFGIDEPLARVVEYFKAAAMGSDVGRRVLLLYGPPSLGNSELCPLCALPLGDHYQGNMFRVPIKQNQHMVIGTFVPSDPKSQDILKLVGSINLCTVRDYRIPLRIRCRSPGVTKISFA